MAAIESKSRTPKGQSIVVRITQDEYDRLQPEISANGSRNLQELARAKVLRAVGEPSLAGVAQKLGALELALARLERALDRPHPSLESNRASLEVNRDNFETRPESYEPGKDGQPSHGCE